MVDRYYVVKMPGPKEAKVQAFRADAVQVESGCLVLSLDGAVVAAFASGWWRSCEMGVRKEQPMEAAPDAA